MKKLSYKTIFVKNRNVRNFEVMMERMFYADEGRFGIMHGQAGTGKTETGLYYRLHNDAIFLRMLSAWGKSELEFLRALCKEFDYTNPPHRKGACFALIYEALLQNPNPVFLDEADRMHVSFLDVIRDISDLTKAPFILIGEEGLKDRMRRNTRVWSRTHYQLEFQNIEHAEIAFFYRESTGLELSPECAEMIYRTTDGNSKPGNFRISKVILLTLIQILNGNKTKEVTEKIVQTAINTAIQGK